MRSEPSPAALAKLDTYMKNGGTILFDTREDGADFGAMTGAASLQGGHHSAVTSINTGRLDLRTSLEKLRPIASRVMQSVFAATMATAVESAFARELEAAAEDQQAG